uniref:Uncharacterized protein n=1 Tax=Anguilla anguilla TaxID=7936 RepID=A0A0E9TX08_ANGAN
MTQHNDNSVSSAEAVCLLMDWLFGVSCQPLPLCWGE